MRNLPVIDYAEAKKIIDLIVERAAQTEKSVLVAVADPHGELIAFGRMDGAPISSTRIGANKTWTAARERKTTDKYTRIPISLSSFSSGRFVLTRRTGSARCGTVCSKIVYSVRIGPPQPKFLLFQ